MPVITYVAPTPQSQDVFFATNNPYQLNGPRGFTEFRSMEETTDLFARIDFPGVIKESVKILLEPSKKAVFVIGNAPKESKHDSSHRKYGTATGLVCDCCEISNAQCFVGDGVVRLILSKKPINPLAHFFCCSFAAARMPTPDPSLGNIVRGYNPEVGCRNPLAHLRGRHTPVAPQANIIGGNNPEVGGGHHLLGHLRGHTPQGCRGTDPFDPAYSGRVTIPHPSVLEGPTMASEMKRLPNGGLYLRIDMPGVPANNFRVMVESGGVTVTGRAPAEVYDSSGREYGGKVAIVRGDYDVRRIKSIAKHGVIRLIIRPPL